MVGRERQRRDIDAERMATVDTILRDMVVMAERETFRVRYLLTYGSKTLELYYDRIDDQFGIVIAANSGEGRQPEETTLLYTAARQLMLSLVHKMSKPVSYALRTEDEKLAAWARSTGERLFHWEDVRVHEDSERPIYEFVTHIVENKRAA